ncbi:phosphoserine phosphatase SerB [Oceaniglobus ichthyenteri]|uniref:phosphoserine phosphatase SerB n=1 Tax=Oceaniglobus ichthyenteri TaxID=2136177 RepID=UPI000D38A9CF|nr:phosphoserine phosphatase SerB [Oceaniglobus ichthyenteri]
MYVVTLLTAPAAATLDPALAEALRNAWGGGDIQWLAPDEAVEFPVAQVPDTLWEVWGSVQAQGVDLILQPMQGRRKRLLIADMDSTMIKQECIDELADLAGVGAQVAGITARAMNGELDFEQALRERVGLLKGLPVAVIDEVLRSRITLMPGGPALLATMKANGAYAALVSGGFTQFTARIAAQLGFDEERANRLIAVDGTLTGDVGQPILGKQAKLDALLEIAARLGIGLDQAMAVGDGANDLAMLQAAGAGIALHAKPSVAAQVPMRINHGDLTALLYLQGYSRDEFILP